MNNCLVFGEALVDEFPDQSVIGGAPFNVARSLALLGVENVIVTRVGEDAHGQAILQECERCGLNTAGVQVDPSRPSGRVAVHLQADGHGHRFEILTEQAYDYIDVEQAVATITQAFPEYPPDLVYFGSMIQRQAVSRACLFALLESEVCDGSTKFLDLNLRDGQFSLESVQTSLSYADIVKLNEDELRYVLAEALPQPYAHEVTLTVESLRLACRAVMAEYMMQVVIVTLGEAGYFYLNAQDEVYTSLGQAKAVSTAGWQLRDTVGAGDAFSACFIRGWLANRPMNEVLEQANAFATAICGVRGALAPDSTFYQAWR